MPLPVPFWMVASGLVLALGGGALYEYYFHPAWRRQCRVVRACQKAFGDGEYRLERLRLSPDDPSITDLFPSPSSLVGARQDSRYFTYNIEPIGDAEPDFSGMSDHEIGFVRHYLHRSADVPHHGKEELRPEEAARYVSFCVAGAGSR